MDLVEEFRLTGFLGQPLDVGALPIGHRSYYEVTGGEIVGARIKAEILGGGEWALIGSDGFLRADVRLQARTDDGAAIYMQYFGLLEMNPAVLGASSSDGGTDFADQYFYTNPRAECSHPDYAWLNTTFFIGQGRIHPQGVEYRVWRPA